MQLIKQLEKTAIGLAILMLFHSCFVYKINSVSLEEAVEANTTTKVEYADGTTVKYSSLYQDEDGSYYSVKKERKDGANLIYKTPIDENMIKNVFVKNEKKSQILTMIGFSILSAVLIVLLINEVENSLGPDFSN